MKTIKICPRCNGTEFLVSAHVVQTWKVDENGNYIEVAEDATDVTHRPADDDLWTCANANCGYEAEGSEFNASVPEDYTIDENNRIACEFTREMG